AIATGFMHRWEISQQQNQFQQQIESLTIALQRSLNRYTAVLTFLSDYYSVADDPVKRQEFADFVSRSLQTYPGIQALEWAPLVTQGDRDGYERAMQAQGYPNFQITQLSEEGGLIPAGDRPYYIPVTYIAPFAGNEAALGFDLNSSAARVAALTSARDSGAIQATGRIRLVQEQRNQYGFLVVLPLYNAAAVTPEARQAQFAGVLVGVFRVSDVVEEALQGLGNRVDVHLRDLSAASEAQFLGRYDAVNQVVEVDGDRAAAQQRPILCNTTESCTRIVDVGQRQWQLRFSPARSYATNVPYGTWATLLVGLLLTSGLALVLTSLQRELERTIALNDLKQRFFSMASHELRTPLSTILLSAESLQTYPRQLSQAQKQASIQRIHLTAQHMDQQITGLLTLTRLEAGKLEIHPELLEVAAFARQLMDDLQVGIRQPIELICSPQVIRAYWDKKLIRSLLSNLLSNAAKYSSKEAPITITLSSDSSVATIAVRDRGIGILEDERARIQEIFQRGSNVGDAAGTGLGLSIVAACVDLHGGDWHIDSHKGQGTTVTVQLPLE
ncbi:MAG: CHASE domain-containing protein, partial [Cyanobacteria bacterium P01_A01_bin.135]